MVWGENKMNKMYAPTMPIRLPNPGLPPRGFPETPEKYEIQFPSHNNHNNNIPDYKIILPKYDKDRSTNHNIDYKIIRLKNQYVH